MPILKNQNKEAFANLVASGMAPNEAFERAGYMASNPESLRVALKRLKDATRARVEELLPLYNKRVVREVVTGTEHSLAVRSNRLKKLEDLYARVEMVMHDRAAHPEMRNVIGGRSGLVGFKKAALRGNEGITIVYNADFDSSIIKAALDIQRQVAVEAGQWAENVDQKTRQLRSLSELPDHELDNLIQEGETILKQREQDTAMGQELPSKLEQ